MVLYGIYNETMMDDKCMAVKKKRKLKVYEQAGYAYKAVPAIVMRGKWLKECGFDVGTKYIVECEEGRLVIVKEEELEPEKKEDDKAGSKKSKSKNLFKVV